MDVVVGIRARACSGYTPLQVRGAQVDVVERHALALLQVARDHHDRLVIGWLFGVVQSRHGHVGALGRGEGGGAGRRVENTPARDDVMIRTGRVGMRARDAEFWSFLTWRSQKLRSQYTGHRQIHACRRAMAAGAHSAT